MTEQDIDRIVEAFARATRWSEEAGFDLVEIHMAHGYLLSTFLSPLSNVRTDAFGGSLENRARFPLQVTRAVRAAWPVDKPLSARISAVDWSPGGSTIEQMIAFSRMLKDAGVDIIDVSTGNVVNVRRPSTGRLFQTGFSDQIRNEVKMPTMTVGRLASHGDINAILAAGRADLCLLAKGHLNDPYFTRHAAEALGHRLAWPNPICGSGRVFVSSGVITLRRCGNWTCSAGARTTTAMRINATQPGRWEMSGRDRKLGGVLSTIAHCGAVADFVAAWLRRVRSGRPSERGGQSVRSGLCR